MTDNHKARREGMRWHMMNALDKSRPIGLIDQVLLDVMREIYPDASPNELHQQLDYLARRKMVELDKKPSGQWHACLSSLGVDLVEYTVDCREGIARPQKYWN